MDAVGFEKAGQILDVHTNEILHTICLKEPSSTAKHLLTWRKLIGETISFCLQLRNRGELRRYAFLQISAQIICLMSCSNCPTSNLYSFRSPSIEPRETDQQNVCDEKPKGTFENYDVSNFFAFHKVSVIAGGKTALLAYLDEPALDMANF
ncbi:hypothetical protein Bca4012_030399 [Brassica carinata]